MNYFSLYRKKSSLARVILVIIFMSFIIELNAQKNDSIAAVSDISGVEINSNLNVPKYLWNLLKENFSIKIQDTTIFYTIDFKVEVPDSNYFEYFTGVISVQYKDNKSTVFVCEGSYDNSNIINRENFTPISIDINGIFDKRTIESYRKFRKHKIEHNKILNSFKILEDRKKESITSNVQFNNRLLSSYERVSTMSKKLLYYELSDSYYKVEFDSFFIVNKYNVFFKYKFKNVNAIMSIHIECSSNRYVEKNRIGLETPSSLNEILERNI